MTFKDSLIAVIGYLLSCILVSMIWLGIAGAVNFFTESPVLAPFFHVGFFWLLFYAGVAGGVLWLWLQIPFTYNRERFDIWLVVAVAPVLTIFASTAIVLGKQGILELLGVIFIGLLFSLPVLLPFFAIMLFFGVLTGLVDIGE